MPTYEYRCEACKHEFEVFQSMSAKPVKVCPKCRKRRVKKLISKGGGLIFKGSGFYLTDYARSKEGAAKSETTAPAETAAKDNKPDATGPAENTHTKDAALKKEATPAKEPEKASKSARKK
jgi:putative FmdB family regulatory protein